MDKKKASENIFMTEDLKREIDLIMHPEKDDKPSKISLIFSFGEEANYNKEEIEKILKSIKNYTNFNKNDKIFYRMDFGMDEVREIYDAYQLIKDLPHKEVLINDYKLPYAGSLWLMLLWFYLCD
jgi:hypothetical protein